MGQLHVFFFPFMAQGHSIPTLDIAKLFATHGVKSTIIATPLNALSFSKTISKIKTQISEIEIGVETVNFPSVEVGLPENCENVDQIPSEDFLPNFFKAVFMLKDQLEKLIEREKPDCLVADMFFPWTTDVAAKYKIPRLVFHGTSAFSLCAIESLRLNKPHKDVVSDDEPFVLPDLPHEIKLTKLQLGQHDKQVADTDTDTYTNSGNLLKKLTRQVKESELSSYGVILNSFYELEPEYIDYYKNVLKRKAWHIGPVSLCNRGIEDKAQRGKEVTIDQHECFKWLNSKKPNSVVYVCFGSLVKFSASQLYEIAIGLENSEQNFIWVVRKWKNDKDENEIEEWLPEGFEERTKEKGLIIRGWAPQVMILDHVSIGGFVTHCGWNSTLEGVSAGVPMVTWPIFAEQFYNEKLVTDVLKIGVGVGSVWKGGEEGVGVGRVAIATVVKKVMVGEEAEEMRNQAKKLKKSAKVAVEEGGSSYYDLKALLKDISLYSA